MKLISIHQPNFLPWPGFFHKWMLADLFIVLDTVQYEKNEWQNRNRIKTTQGAQWVTVPVCFRYPEKISEVMIADHRWARKVCRSIEQAYAKAPYFGMYWASLHDVFNQPYEHLRDLNIEFIRLIGDAVGCSAPLVLASEMDVDTIEPTQRLIQLCAAVNGDGYLSGQEGRTYLQRGVFARSGLELYFQQVKAPEYPQLHGEFMAHLSVLDILFNTGADASVVIRGMGGMVQ